MIHFVTYSAANMTHSREVCVAAARKFGCDMIHEFDIKDVDNEFYSANHKILESSRGCGYWLQKPYFINKVIDNADNEDYIVYCDAGCELINPVQVITCRMDQDIFLFSNGHQHVHWCKADILKAILHRDMIGDHYQQVQASLIFFRISAYTRSFIKEWLLFAQMPGLIDDSPSKLPNHKEFAENRYDQAILGTLAIRDNIKLHWWPDKKWYLSQRYRWPDDTYPPMLLHHRYRNKGEGKGDVEWP